MLAQRVQAAGWTAVTFPLLETADLPPDSDALGRLLVTLNGLQNYAMAAFVSPNAVHAVFRQLAVLGLQWPRQVTIAVMGEGSRQALAEYGIDDRTATIVSPLDPLRSDSETLLEQIDLPALQGRRVVIFRSESGRELLAEALAAHGAAVDRAIAYQRLAPTPASPHVQRLSALLTGPAIWVVSSSEALRTLATLASQTGGPAAVVKMHQIRLWVSHQRIAENAKNSGFQHVLTIGSGDENLLKALTRYNSVHE